MHHYLTKYKDDKGQIHIVAWLQFNLFGRCYSFSKKKLVIRKDN